MIRTRKLSPTALTSISTSHSLSSATGSVRAQRSVSSMPGLPTSSVATAVSGAPCPSPPSAATATTGSASSRSTLKGTSRPILSRPSAASTANSRSGVTAARSSAAHTLASTLPTYLASSSAGIADFPSDVGVAASSSREYSSSESSCRTTRSAPTDCADRGSSAHRNCEGRISQRMRCGVELKALQRRWKAAKRSGVMASKKWPSRSSVAITGRAVVGGSGSSMAYRAMSP
jgi:hypothetical protein